MFIILMIKIVVKFFVDESGDHFMTLDSRLMDLIMD